MSDSAIPCTVALQAPLSMGLPRQEYWSGMPLPSPGHLSDPGTQPESPARQADSLPAEPPGKLKNTEVGSLPLLQGIFLTQELNQGLLHCRFFISQATREALVSTGSSRYSHIEER